MFLEIFKYALKPEMFEINILARMVFFTLWCKNVDWKQINFVIRDTCTCNKQKGMKTMT